MTPEERAATVNTYCCKYTPHDPCASCREIRRQVAEQVRAAEVDERRACWQLAVAESERFGSPQTNYEDGRFEAACSIAGQIHRRGGL